MIFKHGELFCGPGGLMLGAIRAKVESKGLVYSIEHAFGTDIDPWACETYAHNICNGEKDFVFCQDIKTLNLNSLPDIDSLAFGFPCNDFSVVGEQKGLNGSYGPLYKYGIKVLNIKKPKFFVAENVRGIRSEKEGITFKKIIEDMELSGKRGYELTSHLYKFKE